MGKADPPCRTLTELITNQISGITRSKTKRENTFSPSLLIPGLSSVLESQSPPCNMSAGTENRTCSQCNTFSLLLLPLQRRTHHTLLWWKSVSPAGQHGLQGDTCFTMVCRGIFPLVPVAPPPPSALFPLAVVSVEEFLTHTPASFWLQSLLHNSFSPLLNSAVPEVPPLVLTLLLGLGQQWFHLEARWYWFHWTRGKLLEASGSFSSLKSPCYQSLATVNSKKEEQIAILQVL